MNYHNQNFKNQFVTKKIGEFISQKLGCKYNPKMVKYQKPEIIDGEKYDPIYSIILEEELTNEQIVMVSNFENEWNENSNTFIDIQYNGKY